MDFTKQQMKEVESKVLARVLAEQQNGLWPTIRGKINPTNQKVSWENQPLMNVGLHSFVVRILLQLYPDRMQVRRAAISGLHAIIHEAIEVGERWVWRWQKNLTQEDYLYPPDWDDICVAVGTLQMGKRVLTGEEWRQVFGDRRPSQYLSPLIPLVINDMSHIGEDFQLEEGGQYKAPLTFMGKEKPGNCVDPVVCVNVLHGLALNGEYHGVVFIETEKYLQSIVASGKLFSDFTSLSRFYLSPWFFGYVLSHLYTSVRSIRRKEILIEFCEQALRAASLCELRPEEAAWTIVALKAAGMGKESILNSLAANALEGFNIHNNIMPIYQHRRLGHVFGSRAGSIMFCLEGLRTLVEI